MNSSSISKAPAPVRLTSGGQLLALSLGGLTLLAFGLRLIGLDQSLASDELFTYDIATQGSLDAVLAEVRNSGENSPPLFFVLAWMGAKVGDPTVAVRLPSLIAGTLVVPLTFLLGQRTVGWRAGLIAGALVALSPFAVFYADEARAYSVLLFLTLLSTLCLLWAFERDTSGGFALYGLSALAVVLTHYTGAFVVVSQAAWALLYHRHRLRALVFAYGVFAAGLLAYLPFYVDQRKYAADLYYLEVLGAFSPRQLVEALLTVVVGYPFVPLREVPGWASLVLAGLGAAVAGAALARAFAARPRRRNRAVSPALALLLALAVAPPIGVALYSLLGSDLLIARNLIASLPPALLLVAALVTAPRAPVALAASVLVLAAMTIGFVNSQATEHRRIPYKDVARFIDARARPADPVLDFAIAASSGPLRRAFDAYFERPHPVFTGGVEDREAWRRAERSGQLFIVALQVPGTPRTPDVEPALAHRFRLVRRASYPANFPLGVFVYRSRADRP